MYAIIDIETTGGSARLEKVTEIAIYLHDGIQITDEFVSLVNPERNIPYFITNLTGITNEMVENAPRFFELARKIIEMTEGRTFVAHNARFDYSFIKEEFHALGYSYSRPVLDTVGLARRLMPGHRSYSLGNICKDLNITINGRHRAAGDALATVRLFEMLLAKEPEPGRRKKGKGKLRELARLNPKLDLEKVAKLPEEPGIYFFYNEKGDLIYIGKSRDLKSRIATHLSTNSTNRAMEMRDQIADITWETTGSELIALLRESEEIKKNKPRFNRALRKSGFHWGIFSFTDDKGYINFVAGDTNHSEKLLSVFASKDRALKKLNELTEKYTLCQKLTGLYDTEGACFHHQVGICLGACCGMEAQDDYNLRAGKAVGEFILTRRNFFIIDRGRNDDEKCAVKISGGKYCGYGYFSLDNMGFGLSALHECIRDAHDNHDIQVILKQYLRTNRVEKIIDY
jgi:DNA polymerase III subunit epsilon